jgi:low affinity Fe/Cu permease
VLAAINTARTIVTFLLVALLQNSQRRFDRSRIVAIAPWDQAAG